MTMGKILKNVKRIRIATFNAFINLYNVNQVGMITWENGDNNVALHIVNRI